MSRFAIRETPEYRRIVALPRRTITRADADALVESLSRKYRRPGASCTLLPWQAMALYEAPRVGGLWGLYPVGTGKTLTFELMPRALGVPGAKCALIAPAVARDKTRDDRKQLVDEGWRLASPPPTFISREELAIESRAKILFDVDPDLLLIDEADEHSNYKAAAPTRIERYIAQREAEDRPVYVVALSGTAMRRSIMDFWHVLSWALGDDSPLPSGHAEAKTWASVIDEGHGGRRATPGPLGDNALEAREWFAERLATTPGVIMVDEDSAGDVPLHITAEYARECKLIDKAYEELALTQALGGIDAESPLARYRMEARTGCGYLERYVDPGPPEDWREKSRSRCRFTRSKIESTRNSERPCDTPAQVERYFAKAKPIVEWMKVRDTYTPETESVWLSDATLEHCAEWLKREKTPSIVWVGGVEFGHRLAELTGLSYYGLGGKCSVTGRGLHKADPKKSMIVSCKAGKRIFNLQAWTRQLFVEPPTSHKDLEQLLGRAHRNGQKNPVHVCILVTSGSVLDYFDTTIRLAMGAKSVQRVTEKVLRAEIDLGRPPRVTKSNRYRWARREVELLPRAPRSKFRRD